MDLDDLFADDDAGAAQARTDIRTHQVANMGGSEPDSLTFAETVAFSSPASAGKGKNSSPMTLANKGPLSLQALSPPETQQASL